MESARLTLMRFLLIIAFGVGSFTVTNSSSAKAVSAGGLSAASPAARAAAFDEHGELEAIDPDQVPILVGEDTPSSRHTGGWYGDETPRSVLDGPGPLSLPRPVTGMISGVSPGDRWTPVQATDAFDGSDGASCCETDPSGLGSNPALRQISPLIPRQSETEIAAA
ncbi:MAG: hypothetical protein K5Q19_10390 [Novosphingobium sp.]|nr:hypothetical protein [Novosphingobium sp.]